MTRAHEQWTARAIVALIVVSQAVVLAPEIEIAVVDLNDSVFHYTIISALVERLNEGRALLDFWMPEWSFGYPVVRGYQPLGHWLVAGAHFLSGRQFPLDALFSFVRYLLLVSFPLSAYAACRGMSAPPLTAAAVALLSPLIASPNLFGIELGSYVWRGHGLYTQLVATHLFVLAIAAGCRAIRQRRSVTVAALLLGATFLAHYVYGYMAAVTLILIAAIPDAEIPLVRRFVRLAWIAIVSFAVAAFQLVPMLADGPFINRSRWEPAWKWDSFGAARVFGLTATGDLLDAQRLPVLSLLALAGALAVLRRRGDDTEPRFVRVFALSGAALWLFLFCGRAAWGPLFKAIGLSDAAQLHRFIGGAQWFLLLLAAIGLRRLWALPSEHRWRFPRAAAIVMTIALLWFPVRERLRFLEEGYRWGRENIAAYNNYRADIDRAVAAVRALGGRSYPGLAAQWGAQFRVGYVPFYAFLSRAHVPAVAFLYHSMALPADAMVRFNELRPEHYRLFDVRSAVAETGRALPPFLQVAQTIGPFKILRAPASRTFELVHVPSSVYVDRRTFYDVNDAWLQSQWPTSGTHLLLDYESAVPAAGVRRLGDPSALTQTPPPVACGEVRGERGGGDTHTSTLDVTADGCYALFKMTYHPNWRAIVDGHPQPAVMLTPGFLGVPLSRGRHTVEMRYQPGALKPLLLGLALPLLFCSFFAERKGLLRAVEERAAGLVLPAGDTTRYALLTAVLILPVAVPYVSAVQPNGHDTLQYLTRVTEFHENIRHGILLPRWAPDLSHGQGQPLFLLNPPLFYYLTELFHVTGLSFVASMNGATLLLIAASAAAMFLLGRWYFGAAGGAVAALAYLYAPYLLVDLYVRTAFAEFSAFPFYPLAFYGFARYARSREPRYLALGALAYAAIWFAHTPAALLFTPLLGAFLLFHAWRARDFRLLAASAGAAVFGMLLAAAVWLPSVVEGRHTHLNRLTEGPLHYASHFVEPHQFFANQWGYGTSVPGDQDGMPFSLGWPQLALAAIAAAATVHRRPDSWKEGTAFFGIAVFIQCFLMTQRARELWDAIPQLHYVAFPWRLLAPTAFCLALLAALIVVALDHLGERWKTAAYVAVIALLVLPALRHAQPASYLTLDPLQWTPRQIAARGAVAGTFDTFESRWIQQRPRFTGDVVEVTQGSASARVVERGPTFLRVAMTNASEAELELPLSHFPGWRLTIDGVEAFAQPPSPQGRIRVAVPPGTHRLEARFGRTPIRWIADATSAAAFLLLGVLAVTKKMPRTSSARSAPAPLP